MEASDAEDRLLNALFTAHPYNTRTRPVQNHSDTVEVKFGVAIRQLVNIVRSSSFLQTFGYQSVDFHFIPSLVIDSD